MADTRVGAGPESLTPLDILRTTSMTQAVEREVERMIVAGELTGGSHVSEQALAARLGVSRGPVREASRSLVQAGLLVAVRNRGVFVREVALPEVLELYDVRATLEGEMAASLHGRAEAGLLKALRKVVTSMRGAARRDDVAEAYKLNVRFHELLADACRNGRLVAIYRAVVRDMHLFRREGLDRFGSLSASAAEHGRLIEVLTSEPAAVIREQFREHVLSGRRRLERGLAGEGTATAR
jgi:DNA-binding GntR family transcriptional regulator